MEDSAKLRLVRCPKCQNLLPELADYSVYQCGGCGTVLRAKLNGHGTGSLWETSDEGQGGGDPARSGNSLGKGVVDLSDNSDFDVKSNVGSSREGQRDSERPNYGHGRFLNHYEDGDEKGVWESGFDVNKIKDERGKWEEQKPQMGRSKFSVRTKNWPNGERGEMEGFLRKPSADMEGVRFSTLNYPDEGTSNGYSSFSYNYEEQWRDYKGTDGVNRVQRLEQDRAELLRKLDELTKQLNQSSEVVNNPKEKVHPDGKMVPPDPYSGPDTWFPDGPLGLNRTSREFFGPNKHVAGPPYFNYHHDPYAYTSGHEMAMPNFPSSMHNPNYVPGYGDPFVPQMMRGSHPLPHRFPQQPMHPYFPGRYADTGPDSYEPYAHNVVPHLPSCSCFRCYDNKRRGSVPAPPAAFHNRRFPHTPNDPMSYHHEIPGAVGPQVHNPRTTIPAVSLHEKQLHTRRLGDFNSETGGFVQSRPRKVMPTSSSRHCLPIAGGSPFITCHNCFELLQLPKKALIMVKNKQQKVRCGACSSEIYFTVIKRKRVISPHPEIKETTTKVDDTPNDAVNRHVSHSHGHVNTSGANFSSDDYSGYDFHSVDRESPVLATDPSLKAGKPQEMHSFHSSSSSTSEDENSPEVMIAAGEATRSIHQPNKSSLSPPPAGSPLQEYFDHSNNNHAVNRFGKGNLSSRSDQEKAKIEKNTTRQNSLKEVVLATEMDVHDYSNTGASQDSGDTSREHEHSRSNKGGESFFANIIKKGFRDFSQSSQIDDHGKSNVTVNGWPISDRGIKKAEKIAGSIQPGNYWYDFRAGFWGVMGGPCLGIIPPFIEEFNYPMPDKCAGGNTGVYVNGRELNQKDFDLLCRRGLPHDTDNRSYIIEISGRVLDEDTGEELDSLGKLAPTVEKAKHGFGMKVPRAAA
ncbi:putative zinc-ribbon domain, plant [Sesbania bispinosa]|nr:putative zinc-ribbon domain, plant [Sesbania bispinosa]